jgi:hypothetical protein
MRETTVHDRRQGESIASPTNHLPYSHSIDSLHSHCMIRARRLPCLFASNLSLKYILSVLM